MLLYEYKNKPFWKAVSYFNSEHLNLLCREYDDLIYKGEILPHSSEGLSLLKTAVSNVKDMNEAQVRQSFILPLLELLGWNKQNPLEVVAEERANGGFLDIKLVHNGKTIFVVEIKRPSVNLEISSSTGQLAAYQGIGYSRSFLEAPITIVTNFERLNIYHSYIIPKKDKVNTNLLSTLLWKNFQTEEAKELLSNISKQACVENKYKAYFDNLVKDQRVIRSTKPLSKKILEDFERWRLDLGNTLYENGLQNVETLNNVVQSILDKLILIRNIQDRGLDSSSLGNLKLIIAEPKIGEKLVSSIFPHFKAVLSEEFFAKSDIEEQYLKNLPDEILRKVILKTYGEDEQGVLEDIYDFSVIPIELLGLAYEQYLGKMFFLDNGKLKLDLKPELKKSGGVCYTPAFVVNYIVDSTFESLKIKNTGETVEKLIKYKFLDPSCGSGSFLVKLFSRLIQAAHTSPEKKSIKLISPNFSQKKQLLKKCIFGVDIDASAVEITKLSLILKLLEGEDQLVLFTGNLVPELSGNIRTGNSLIEPKDLTSITDVEIKQKTKPLEWDTFQRDIGVQEGFSAIVGNPPYVRNQVFIEFYPQQADILARKYKSYESGNVDLYLPFVEKSLQLLKKGGIFSYIMPHRFWNADYGKTLRNYIRDNYKLKEILNYRAEQVFDGVTTYTAIMSIQANQSKKSYKFRYFEGKPLIGPDPITKLVTEVKLRGSKDQKIIFEELNSEILNEDNWFFAPDTIREKIIRLEKSSIPFADFVSDAGLYQGVISGSDELLFKKDEWGEKPLNKYIVKLLKGSRDMKAFTKPEVKEYLIYPYNLSGNIARLASLDEIRAESPEISDRLEESEDILRSRVSLKTKTERTQDLEDFPDRFDKDGDGNLIWKYLEDDYYKYVRSQALSSPKKPKVLVPSLFKRPTFIPDINGEYVTPGSGSGGGGGYIFTLKDEYLKDLKSLVAILGSDLLKLWFERRGDLFKGYYIGVDKADLKNIPIPYRNITDEEKSLLAQYCDDLFNCEDKRNNFFTEILNSLNFLVEELSERGSS